MFTESKGVDFLLEILTHQSSTMKSIHNEQAVELFKRFTEEQRSAVEIVFGLLFNESYCRTFQITQDQLENFRY